MNSQKSISPIVVTLIVITLLAGGILVWQYLGGPKEKGKETENENYCEKNTDCACGVNINTGDCFYGNKDYVDTTRQCPDFCTGITENLIIRCINNQCIQRSKEIEEETADWKTYRNEKFGFEFKYPPELEANSSGPNEEQKKVERGETTSGTVPPSYDTITFSSSTKKEQFNVIISAGSLNEISPAGFKDYLSMGSVCDTRWIDSISGEPTLLDKNGIPILEVEVQVIPSGPRGGGSSAGCYYFKNSEGNLVVFNISGFEQKSDFLNTFHLVGDKILSTLSLIK